MTKDIGPMDNNIPPFAELTLNGNRITHYMDMPELPDDQGRKTCIQHFEEGRPSEMLTDFDIIGCHYPKPDEEQMIRTAFVCPGPSMLKKCRLRLIQADAEGKVLTEGKFQ